VLKRLFLVSALAGLAVFVLKSFGADLKRYLKMSRM
jgi:hypothetical protein